MSEDSISDIGTLFDSIKDMNWIQDLDKIPYKTIKVLYNIIIPIWKNLINNRKPVAGNHLGSWDGLDYATGDGLHYGARGGLHLISRGGDRMELGI